MKVIQWTPLGRLLYIPSPFHGLNYLDRYSRGMYHACKLIIHTTSINKVINQIDSLIPYLPAHKVTDIEL